MGEYLLTQTAAAAYLGYKVCALAAWRLRGGGPLFVRVSGRSVRYRKTDLDAWINERLRATTSDNGEAAAAKLAEAGR